MSRFPTKAELQECGMIVHDFDYRETVWCFDSEAECYAAIRTLAWITANTKCLVGYCTLPKREGVHWIVTLGASSSQ